MTSLAISADASDWLKCRREKEPYSGQIHKHHPTEKIRLSDIARKNIKPMFK